MDLVLAEHEWVIVQILTITWGVYKSRDLIKDIAGYIKGRASQSPADPIAVAE